jgi:hypothetical protein
MDDQPAQQDLFEIKLTASGKIYIRKFAIIARIIILVGIIISFIHIASTVMWQINLEKYDLGKNSDLWLEYKVLPYYTLVYCILFYSQMYFYWQATKFLRKGLQYNDEKTFNKAFRSLFRYVVFGVASILLSALSYGFELYRYIKDYVR